MNFLKYLTATLVAILAPIKPLLFSVGFLVLADLATGIWAAYKRGEKIDSSALRRTITKIAVYQVAVVSGFLVQQYMLSDALPVSKIVASVIGLVELKSILENSDSILGYSLFKSVVAKLGSDNDGIKAEIKKQVADAVDKQLK